MKKQKYQKILILVWVSIIFLVSTAWAKKQEKLVDTITGLQVINTLKATPGDFLILTWTKPASDSTSITYNIYRSTTSDGPWKKLNRKLFTGLKYSDYSAKEGQKYQYLVEVIDKGKTVVGISNSSKEKFSPYTSGLVLTSTAFRNLDYHRGLNIDFLLSYYIGRLYGENKRNTYDEKPTIDMISAINFMLFTSDIKLVLESEYDWPFSWSTGYKYMFLFASKKPPVGQSASLSFRLGDETGSFGSAYVVVGKTFLRTSFSAGLIQGEDPRVLQFLSEYLSARPDWELTRLSSYFCIDTRIIPTIRLKIEALHPLNNPLDPWVIHTNLGQVLKTNFDIAFIKYKEGFDVIGGFWFRFTLFPRAPKK